MFKEKLIEVNVTGFNITALDEDQEVYDIFVPMNAYRLTNKQVYMFIPASHELVDTKRTSERRYVTYEDLIKISK